MEPSDSVLLPRQLQWSAIRDLPAAAIITDAEQRIIFANLAFQQMSGYGLPELLGVNCRILQGRETDPTTVAAIRAALHDGRSFREQILNFRKDGAPFWNLLTVTPLRDEDLRVTHFVSVQLDITDSVEQAETTATLLALAKELNAGPDQIDVAQKASDAVREFGIQRSAVAIFDAETHALRIAGLSGWGPLTDAFRNFVPVEYRWPELETILSDPRPLLVTVESASAWTQEVLLRSDCTALAAVPMLVDGTVRGFVIGAWGHDTQPETLSRTLSDRLVGIAGLAAVALRNLELVEHIRQTAQIDPLTGLVTRAVLHDRLTASVDQPGAGLVGVIYCDVDRFKWINDALGHGGGDEALQQIAGMIRSTCPATAIVCRPGGDEFVVLLPVVHAPEEIASLVERLGQRFKTPLIVHEREIYVTLSIGSALLGPDDTSSSTSTSPEAAERVIREADAAMYSVKRARRGLGLDASGIDLLQLDADLHHAIDRGEIIAHFQPQYDSRIGNLTGFEALARWNHPRYGTLGPDRFIDLADATGLIHTLGDEIFRQACQFADSAAEERPLQIQVNVSAQQLTVPGLASRIQRALSGYPDRTWTLNLEITESTLIGNHEIVLAELRSIRRLGVGLAIDDFGSGYSSLSQLRDLPATELKIDKSFVHREGAVAISLLTAIIALGRSLDLTVIAEGIETQAQLATLRRLGSDRLQGIYLCPPLPPEEALKARPDVAALLPSNR